jgi:hypothetical protein
MLTADDIRLLLDLIAEKHRFGYAKDPAVAQVQARLSVMLEAKARVARIQISSHRFEPGWRGQQDRCGYNGCSWTADHHVVDRTTPEVNRAVPD